MQFVVCVKNNNCPASLERRKIYQVLTDASAEANGLMRVIDESGEDYLYPASYFLRLTLPKAVEDALQCAA